MLPPRAGGADDRAELKVLDEKTLPAPTISGAGWSGCWRRPARRAARNIIRQLDEAALFRSCHKTTDLPYTRSSATRLRLWDAEKEPRLRKALEQQIGEKERRA